GWWTSRSESVSRYSPTVAGLTPTNDSAAAYANPRCQPCTSARWAFQVPSVACAEPHASATSGYPSGGLQFRGACPNWLVIQYRPSTPLAVSSPGATPRMRAVATTFSSGRRVFSPTDIQNSTELNNVRSIGTIAEPLSR